MCNEVGNNFLVSVIIITYNSSKYVLETLESVKKQTYKNIELIVSDDCSTDNTVEICEAWIKENQSFFKRAKIIAVEKNTGIPSNCNRGVNSAKGEWVKLIAGDDILLNECVEINLKYVLSNDSPLFYSKMNVFDGNKILEKNTNNYNNISKKFGLKNKNEKKRSYLRYPIMLNIPTFFIKRELIVELKGYDERFKLLEDQPFLYKLFLNNYDVFFIEETTVLYRFHNESIIGSGGKSELFKENLFDSYRIYARPNLNNLNIKDLIFKLFLDTSFYIQRENLDKYFVFSAFLRLKNIIYKLN